MVLIAALTSRWRARAPKGNNAGARMIMLAGCSVPACSTGWDGYAGDVQCSRRWGLDVATPVFNHSSSR